MPRFLQHILLFAACVLTRVGTAIGYVEDPDSLRFAQSVAHGFDLANLQPHFPGYPIFWAVARGLYLLTGSFATSFALIGGIATYALILALLWLLRERLTTVRGLLVAALVWASPLIWLLGTRYMPDLSGTALAFGGLAALIAALEAPSSRRRAVVAGLACAALAGWRLSYLPMLAPLGLYLLYRSERRALFLAGGMAGLAVWLTPLVLDTGWHDLVQVATAQTSGHFTEFGGSVQTEPNPLRRLAGFAEGFWADGLGGYWAGRHPITLLLGLLTIGALVQGALRLPWHERRLQWLFACAAAYALWILFGQNVIHKSRHLLPLLPLAFVFLAYGLQHWWKQRLAGRAATATYFILLFLVTSTLARQHEQPTAIAQVRDHLDRTDPEAVLSIPLVHFFLEAQQIDARYVAPADTAALRDLLRNDRRVAVVGRYPGLPEPARRDTFYHNPYVNRMWSEIVVSTYE